MARAELTNRDGHLEIAVTLSRRNLLALLHKLDMPGSSRTITNNDCRLDGKWVSTHELVLCCEDDLEHYARRVSGPGPMHPKTERFIHQEGGWSPLKG